MTYRMYGHEFGYIKARMGITYGHLSDLSNQDNGRRSMTYFWLLVTENKLVPVRWVKLLRAYCTEKVFLELRAEYANLPAEQRKVPDDEIDTDGLESTLHDRPTISNEPTQDTDDTTDNDDEEHYTNHEPGDDDDDDELHNAD